MRWVPTEAVPASDEVDSRETMDWGLCRAEVAVRRDVDGRGSRYALRVYGPAMAGEPLEFVTFEGTRDAARRAAEGAMRTCRRKYRDMEG